MCPKSFSVTFFHSVTNQHRHCLKPNIQILANLANTTYTRCNYSTFARVLLLRPRICIISYEKIPFDPILHPHTTNIIRKVRSVMTKNWPFCLPAREEHLRVTQWESAVQRRSRLIGKRVHPFPVSRARSARLPR